MIEDTSSAAWYQQSMLSLDGRLLWTVKECFDDFEYHLIRQMDLHEDFFQTLELNKGLPPTSISATTMLYNRAIHDT
jgi:hypothetical protein